MTITRGRGFLPALPAIGLTLVALLLVTLPRPGVASRVEGGREAVVEMVQAAAAAIREHGFPRALSRSDPATWSRPDARLYVFLMGSTGTMLLHPDKRVEGRNVSGTADVNGKPFIRVIIAAAAAHPEGVWTSYVWPSGSSGRLGTKHTYSIRVGNVIVSAGYVAADV